MTRGEVKTMLEFLTPIQVVEIVIALLVVIIVLLAALLIRSRKK